jgi:hypothetical protein
MFYALCKFSSSFLFVSLFNFSFIPLQLVIENVRIYNNLRVCWINMCMSNIICIWIWIEISFNELIIILLWISYWKWMAMNLLVIKNEV